MLIENVISRTVLENSSTFSSLPDGFVLDLCGQVESLWEENKIHLAPLLMSAQCEENTCRWGDNKEFAIRYLRNEEGCAIQLNSGEDQTKFSVMGDTHVFSMKKPHSMISGRTDYETFVSANWHSTEGAMAYGNLKVERSLGSSGEEVFTLELANTQDDLEANFSAECRLGQNEAVCEINRGDLLSKWFVGNKVIVSMNKNIDTNTLEETIKFAIQTKPLFGVLPGIQLGKFEVTFNPQGAFSAQGNVHLPGSKQPLFAGTLNCKDPETCNGEGAIDFTTDLGNGEKVYAQLESDPQHVHYYVNGQSNSESSGLYRRSNLEVDANLQFSDHGIQFTQDVKDKLETPFTNKQTHIKTDAQLDTSNGIKADYSIKDLSQSGEVKTEFLAAYDYNTKDPKADTYRAHLQLPNGFEAEGKVRAPK